MKLVDGMKLNKAGDWEYYLDGQPVTEAVYRQRYPLPVSRPGDIVGGTPARGWPMKSEALAVHPDQVEEGNARNRTLGIGVEYEPKTGKAIIPDSRERKKLLKAEGYIDRDGFGL